MHDRLLRRGVRSWFDEEDLCFDDGLDVPGGGGLKQRRCRAIFYGFSWVGAWSDMERQSFVGALACCSWRKGGAVLRRKCPGPDERYMAKNIAEELLMKAHR